MLRVITIFTGGTIGSEENANVIDLKASASHDLIGRYQECCGNDVDFVPVTPYCILSENCTPAYWEILFETISSLNLEGADGILVTHGTDTLSYTAAFLGLCFGNTLPVPLVIVGSNKPLGEPGSNGFENFKNGVSLIREKNIGVLVIYQNHKGENQVHLATRILESDSYRDQFLSFGHQIYGEMRNGKFLYARAEENPPLEAMVKKRELLSFHYKKPVMLLRPYPGIDYGALSIDGVGAVLHYMYHSGTASIQGGNGSVLSLIGRCMERGIPFYAASFKKQSPMYGTSREILSAGALPLYHISQEAAYAKIVLAYNQKDVEPELLMEENLYYEIL